MKESKPRLIVIWPFQKWFLIRFVSTLGGFLIVFGIGIYFWFRFLTSEVLNALDPTLQELIQNQLKLGSWAIVGFLLSLLLVGCIQSFILSRAIAGPIFAISRHLERCEQEGKFTPLHLRQSDLLKDFCDQINHVGERAFRSENK